MTVIAKNPIMPGFYPDPSICAVGEDFYLVNSTFAYFPGLPILHSRDLVHWEQIGNAMHRESQLPLQGSGHSGGLFAPTIRYHGGIFYVICTNISHGGNYIVTAQNPEGPWSEPYYLEGAQGIDPSLFFDEDGKCYYMGTRPNPEGCKYGGDWYIWTQELDLNAMKLIGEPKDVWNGAMRNVIWPEGPHLYKKNGYYYIMHAEGGTGPDHAVTICRSRNLFGPYENNTCNPILTHRHLGKEYPIRYVGHADLFETKNGEWYMVMLAVRQQDGYTTLGRETFLAKVVWENDWPVVNPLVGMLTEEVEIALPEWNPETDKESYTYRNKDSVTVLGGSKDYDFSTINKLGHEFLFLRNPRKDMYQLKEKEGLWLTCGKETLKEEASPSYISIRQQHHNFLATAKLVTDNLKGKERAGLALVQSNEYHLRIELDKDHAYVILCESGEDRLLGECSIAGGVTEIYMRIEGLQATMGTIENGKEFPVVSAVDIHVLSTEVAGGFVGCTVGLYATANGEESEQAACFKQFNYLV